MNAGIENNLANFSGECRPCPSTFDFISPNDFVSLRSNRQQNDSGQRNSFESSTLGVSPVSGSHQMRPEFMMRPDMSRQSQVFNPYDRLLQPNTFMQPNVFSSLNRPMRPNVFMQPDVFNPFYRPMISEHCMQPNMVQNQLHQGYDSYWKNYWQEYYRRADRFAPPQRWQDESWTEHPYENEEHEYEEEHSPLPQRRRPNHRHNDRPNDRPRPGFEEPQERPNRPQSDRTNSITQAARDSVGQQLFKFIPGTPGRLGCAASVSAALNKAGFNYAKHAGVAGLSQILQRNGWTKQDGLQNAQPGDVVVIVRRSGWENGGGGSHIGIVGENGKVYHNSSSRQQWIEDSLQRVFGGGIQRFILRPPRS